MTPTPERTLRAERVQWLQQQGIERPCDMGFDETKWEDLGDKEIELAYFEELGRQQDEDALDAEERRQWEEAEEAAADLDDLDELPDEQLPDLPSCTDPEDCC